MRREKNLRFTDWHPMGLLGGVLFISTATLFLVVFWGTGVQPNLSWRGNLVLWVVRFAVTAFMMLFYYGGLGMLFGTFCFDFDFSGKVIRYRERPPPLCKRGVIPFATVQSVSIEPRVLSGPFTSRNGFGVFIVADRSFFIFETRHENDALAMASRVAKVLETPVRNNGALVEA